MSATANWDREQWALVVRRSFEIPDPVSDSEAQDVLVARVEGVLRDNGWTSATRAVAEAVLEAVVVVGASGDLGDLMPAADASGSDAGLPIRDAALRVLDTGTTIVDPEDLVFDGSGDYPPEIVASVQQVLDRVNHYVREQPLG
jgi:hypothetical protein